MFYFYVSFFSHSNLNNTSIGSMNCREDVQDIQQDDVFQLPSSETDQTGTQLPKKFDGF